MFRKNYILFIDSIKYAKIIGYCNVWQLIKCKINILQFAYSNFLILNQWPHINHIFDQLNNFKLKLLILLDEKSPLLL